jgi:hypothetical protein
VTYAARPLDSFMFAADCDGRSGDHSFTKDGGRRRTITVFCVMVLVMIVVRG